jgi:hypothetical protein
MLGENKFIRIIKKIAPVEVKTNYVPTRITFCQACFGEIIPLKESGRRFVPKKGLLVARLYFNGYHSVRFSVRSLSNT